ncbi:MAG: aminodeoxychorismate/anthranilate synthase component II [archaeon]
MKILLIDNYDSFTYNLVDEFEKRGHAVLVYRNDADIGFIDKVIKKEKPGLIVLSPGPGTPGDAGICIEMIKKYHAKIPIFGICLGHQAIVEAFGGKVGKADETLHGKTSLVYHAGVGLYRGIENPFAAGRYHSLCAICVPDCLEVTSKTESGIVMGVCHKSYPVFGVQFHPESILTPVGGKMIENVVNENDNEKDGGKS